MIDREVFAEQQGFQNIDNGPMGPLPLRWSFFVWISLCAVGWMGMPSRDSDGY